MLSYGFKILNLSFVIPLFLNRVKVSSRSMQMGIKILYNLKYCIHSPYKICLDILCTICLFSSDMMSVPYKLVVDKFDFNFFTPFG